MYCCILLYSSDGEYFWTYVTLPSISATFSTHLCPQHLETRDLYGEHHCLRTLPTPLYSHCCLQFSPCLQLAACLLSPATPTVVRFCLFFYQFVLCLACQFFSVFRRLYCFLENFITMVPRTFLGGRIIYSVHIIVWNRPHCCVCNSP